MDTPSSLRFTGTLQGRDSDTLNNIADQTFFAGVPHGINFTQPRLKNVKRGHVYSIKELHNDDIHEYDWEWHEDDNFILGKHNSSENDMHCKAANAFSV
ncbi:hypothetical protein VNI00_000261 [Paramarasmius palmivorus]|uniref:Uncharacterized protein n=1 Tax=Paramarasmius palmivorus TaxID=297713 RepID=A0AAW0EEF4_9AGAR